MISGSVLLLGNTLTRQLRQLPVIEGNCCSLWGRMRHLGSTGSGRSQAVTLFANIKVVLRILAALHFKAQEVEDICPSSAWHLNRETVMNRARNTFAVCPRWQENHSRQLAAAAKPNTPDRAAAAFLQRGAGVHPGQVPPRGAGSCTVKTSSAGTHGTPPHRAGKGTSQHPRCLKRKQDWDRL